MTEFNSPFKKSKKNELTEAQKELVREYIQRNLDWHFEEGNFIEAKERIEEIKKELGL